MTKLKEQTEKVESAIQTLKGDIKALDKESIQKNINDKTQLIELLENLMENKDIQKKYPKYLKLKKLFYILPGVLTALLTIALLVTSILLSDPVFTQFLPVIAIAADYLTYHYTSIICDKQIADNEEYKPYFDVYGDKEYSAKRSVKDLHQAENELNASKSSLNECEEKERSLNNLEDLLKRLYRIRDEYIEKNLEASYSKTEIDEISTLFSQVTEKGIEYVKK